MDRAWGWLLETLQAQPGLPVLGLLALVFWGYWRSQVRAQRNQDQGLCAQCGAAPATVTLYDLERPLDVCDQCANATEESQSVVYYSFIAMGAILFVLWIGLILASLAGGSSADWRVLGTLGLIVAGNVALVLRMRDARRKRRKHDAAQQ